MTVLGVLIWRWWPTGMPTELRARETHPAHTTASTTPPRHPTSTNRPQAAPRPRDQTARKPDATNVMVATPSPAPPKEAPTGESSVFPRPVRNVFEAQVALARQGLSPGSIDGVPGKQTRSALEAFQRKEHLPVTGHLDAATVARLVLATPPLTEYTVTRDDLARLQPLSPTWIGKSEQHRLDYETLVEEVAEKAESYPSLMRSLNPGIDWAQVAAGARLTIPQVRPPPVAAKAAFVRIQLSTRTLEALDADARLLAHFPCSIARFASKRPLGELHIVKVVPNPVYVFDPTNFPESAEARTIGHKLDLPPGPNNPVGVVWIALDKPGYGIHGTPQPEHVGRTESHGCFRLANWNAEFLSRLVQVGTPVFVEP
jgi:lipoprotein-anchoring transpeptidase ErfK/SrfK